MAELLTLPSGGATKLVIGGAAADAYFRNLSENIGRPARDAEFAVYGESVQVVPARDGLELNVPKAARAILRAATRPTNRVAQLTVARALPERTTAEALAMGIDTRMASYKTYYSGTADRITNLQLGVRALDGTLVAPGGTFSLNEAIGERTVERGFRSAPVIIGNEYAEEVGGGTSQVATTAFNAAWEAGLRITERNPHSLYISRYQLGRDATVYWPSLDLKFVNDTDTWVLVKGFAEGDGISIAIYGGESRRVESSSSPLVVTGRVPVERVERSDACQGQDRRRGGRVVTDADVGDAEGVLGRRRAAPLGDVDDVLQGRGARRSRRDEGRGEEDEARPAGSRRRHGASGRAGRYPDEASAVAIASASHSGIRMGRYVSRSTVACRVVASATSSPSRSIRYS